MLNQLRRDTDEQRLDHRVTSLLAAAAAPTEPGPLTGEAEVLAAFRARRDLPRRPPLRSSLTPLRVTAAAFVSTLLLLTGTVAATATGSLPGPAQDTMHEWLTKFGVIAPAADKHHKTPAPSAPDAGAGGRRTRRATDHGAASDRAGQGHANGPGKGAAVSSLARRSRANGAAKGGSGSEHAARHGHARGAGNGARQSQRTSEPAGTGPPSTAPRSVSLKRHTVDEGPGRLGRRVQGRRRFAPSAATP